MQNISLFATKMLTALGWGGVGGCTDWLGYQFLEAGLRPPLQSCKLKLHIKGKKKHLLLFK
jgi:hypothetical protein